MNTVTNAQFLSESDINPLLSGGIDKQEPASPQGLELGIDFLSFSYDVNTDLMDEYSPLWTVKGTGLPPIFGEAYIGAYANLPFGKTSVNIDFDVRKLKAYVRFNPSTALYGKSLNLIHPGACQRLVGHLMDEISSLVPPSFDEVQANGTITRAKDWASQVGLQRVDCARNLLIEEPLLFMREAEAQSPKWMREVNTRRLRKGGWCLTNKTVDSGRDLLYHKEAELALHEMDELLTREEGTWFRFETQLRKDRIKQFGFYTLADVCESTMWNAIQKRWEACRWGVFFPEPGVLKSTLGHLTFTQQCNVVGYLAMHSLGMEDGYSVSKHRHVGKLVKELGLRLGDPIETQGKGNRYVDIRSGRVVVVAKPWPL